MVEALSFLGSSRFRESKGAFAQLQREQRQRLGARPSLQRLP